MAPNDGFTTIPNWIAAHPRLSASDKGVFLAIAMFADNKTRDCWPSYEKLMQASGIANRNYLAKHLANLERVGAITIVKPFTKHNPRRSNRYFIHELPPGDYAIDADGFHLVGDRRFDD